MQEPSNCWPVGPGQAVPRTQYVGMVRVQVRTATTRSSTSSTMRRSASSSLRLGIAAAFASAVTVADPVAFTAASGSASARRCRFLSTSIDSGSLEAFRDRFADGV